MPRSLPGSEAPDETVYFLPISFRLRRRQIVVISATNGHEPLRPRDGVEERLALPDRNDVVIVAVQHEDRDRSAHTAEEFSGGEAITGNPGQKRQERRVSN